jgi:hypothetical protein
MTAVQRVAQLSGWLFVLIAIWGAVVTGTSMEADPATADRLWGLFPVNFVHNLVHLLIGLWGLSAAKSFEPARTYAVGAGALYILLAVLGVFFPAGFGLVPLGGNDIWLHALLGVALLLAGVTLAPASAPKVEPAGTRTVRPPTASSSESTVTRPPAQPDEPEGHAEPLEPEPAGSEGAAEGAPPPGPPEHVVDEPPQQPERSAGPSGEEDEEEGPERRDERPPDRTP